MLEWSAVRRLRLQDSKAHEMMQSCTSTPVLKTALKGNGKRLKNHQDKSQSLCETFRIK